MQRLHKGACCPSLPQPPASPQVAWSMESSREPHATDNITMCLDPPTWGSSLGNVANFLQREASLSWSFSYTQPNTSQQRWEVPMTEAPGPTEISVSDASRQVLVIVPDVCSMPGAKFREVNQQKR